LAIGFSLFSRFGIGDAEFRIGDVEPAKKLRRQRQCLRYCVTRKGRARCIRAWLPRAPCAAPPEFNGTIVDLSSH
jgi:hypothetical protein